MLLISLREAGAEEQVARLVGRDPAAHVSLDNPDYAVPMLVDTLRETGAEEQAMKLVDRLPAEGHFGLFCRQSAHHVQYRYGREPDGSPTSPWGWGDLD
jgi:hypothetical protein